MWQIWLGFWTHTALATQSMYTNWILSTLPLITSHGLPSASRHRLSEPPDATLQCPACDSHMTLATQQQPSRVPSHWLSCSRCGVSRLLVNLPQAVDSSMSAIKKDSNSEQGIPGQR